MSESARRTRGHTAALAVLTLLVAAFLREPIARYSTHTFACADFSQELTLTRIERGATARNPVITDPYMQFLPWLVFNERELAAGRVPLWNPYNACGVPHLANVQSAVFSPFSAPFYVLSLKLALLVTSFAKLLLAGFGTYLFLRRIGLAWLAALFGGASFMFCGHNTLLLAYPHTAVIAALPFALLAAEALLQSTERDSTRAPRTGTWIAFVATLVAAIYAGHPETLFFTVALVALWIGVRLANWWRRTRDTRAASALGARFVVAALLAAGLGAPQLLPFFEYLQLSSAVAQRVSDGPVALDVATWPRYFFPDLLGSPGRQTAFAGQLPPPNYEAATLGYVGALTLLLAAFALPRALRDARFAPFAVLAALWVVWAHDVLGFARAVSAIPLLRHVPIPVSQGAWGFAIALCAAFQLQRLFEAPRRRAWLSSAAVLLIGLLALALFHRQGSRISDAAIELHTPSATAIAYVRSHFAFIASTCALGIAAWAAALWLSGRARVAALTALVAASLLQIGWPLSFHNTACPDRFVWPTPPQLERLRELSAGARVVPVGSMHIAACANVAYELDQPALYDALNVATFDRLYVRHFNGGDDLRQARRADPQALLLFGVEWLVAPITSAQFELAADEWRRNPLELGIRPREHVGELGLFDFAGALGRHWLVARARVARSDDEAFELATAPDFDPGELVVLGPELPASFTPREPTSATTRNVEVLERNPQLTRLRIAHDAPEFLVLAQTWFPGWRARIDGEPAERLRANYAFTALEVPPGEHVVELEYAPASWRIGLWLAAASAVVGITFALASLRARRANAHST